MFVFRNKMSQMECSQISFYLKGYDEYSEIAMGYYSFPFVIFI